jgi:hypothetical protein
MSCICLFMYECVCGPLAPESLDQFYSYSIFKSFSPMGRRPMNKNILFQKRAAVLISQNKNVSVFLLRYDTYII